MNFANARLDVFVFVLVLVLAHLAAAMPNTNWLTPAVQRGQRKPTEQPGLDGGMGMGSDSTPFSSTLIIHGTGYTTDKVDSFLEEWTDDVGWGTIVMVILGLAAVIGVVTLAAYYCCRNPSLLAIRMKGATEADRALQNERNARMMNDFDISLTTSQEEVIRASTASEIEAKAVAAKSSRTSAREASSKSGRPVSRKVDRRSSISSSDLSSGTSPLSASSPSTTSSGELKKVKRKTSKAKAKDKDKDKVKAKDQEQKRTRMKEGKRRKRAFT